MSTASDARELDAALPPPPELELVICDCDGVLFESYAANVAFYDAVLVAAGLPPLDEAGRRLCYTLASTQLFEELFGDRPAVLEHVRRTAQTVDYGPFYELMEPAENLVETLHTVHAHCGLALATNRGRTVEGVVARFGLSEFFPVRVGVLDVPRPKPAPDMLLACLERTGVAARRAVYVGDSPTDRVAARAAGIAYVALGVTTDAPIRVEAFRDVPDVLQLPRSR